MFHESQHPSICTFANLSKLNRKKKGKKSQNTNSNLEIQVWKDTKKTAVSSICDDGWQSESVEWISSSNWRAFSGIPIRSDTIGWHQIISDQIRSDRIGSDWIAQHPIAADRIWFLSSLWLALDWIGSEHIDKIAEKTKNDKLS